jgi:7-keto-8-aminopelargonate synthetase-like enzyme
VCHLAPHLSLLRIEEDVEDRQGERPKQWRRQSFITKGLWRIHAQAPLSSIHDVRDLWKFVLFVMKEKKG